MKIAFNQPAFIPWGGFFARLMSSDRMVLLDDTWLARGFTYVNRNRIKGPSGEIWITVPLKRKSRGRQKIKDLEIYEKKRWAKKFLLTLRHYYGKSLYFAPISEKIESVLDTSEDGFLGLIHDLLKILREGLDIGQEMVLQSQLGLTGQGTPLLVSIAKELGAQEVIFPYFAEKHLDWSQFREAKIKVTLLHYLPPQYPQFWGDYLMNLSALDLLLCMGKEGRTIIAKGIRLSGL